MIFSEEDFYAYCKYVAQERCYKKSWCDAMFKSTFNKWASKSIRGIEMQKPTEEFYDWLYSYFEISVSKGEL